MSENVIEVRRLNASDLFKMAKILSIVVGDVRENLGGQKLEEMDSQFIGFMIVEACMKNAEGEFKEFLASLVNMKVKEFEKQSFDLPIQIIETLQEQEDLKDFLFKARGLMKVFSGKSST